MPDVLRWIFEQLVCDRPKSADTTGLSAGVLVGDAEGDFPADLDLVVAMPDARDAERLLRTLLRAGTVGRVWLDVSDELPPTASRRLWRFARRLRSIGMDVRPV